MRQYIERTFQKSIQHKLGYGHKKLPCGVTDVTTKTTHIEIKKWCQWKHGMGQILAYNYYDKKPHLAACFFGEYPEEKKMIAMKVLEHYNIQVIDLTKISFQDHQFD